MMCNFLLLTGILSLTYLASLSQSFDDIKVTKKYTAVPLRTVLADLHQTYNVNFFYVDQQIDSIVVTTTILHQDLGQAMRLILNKTKMRFYFENDQVVLFYDSGRIPSKEAPVQNVFTIQGIVTDQKTGEPMPSVNVYVLNSHRGVYTDINGKYILKDLPNDIYIIQFSFIGFVTEERKINLLENVELNISLIESPLELQPIEISPNVYEVSLTEQSPLTLTDKEILHSPNLIKDVSRTMRVLPGLANNDFSAKPRIRGGGPDETVFYLDNFEILEPFHVEEFNGVFTVFNTDYISKLKVIPGGFGTSYADKISGIVDLTTPDRVDKNEVSASLDLINTSFLLKQKLNNKLDIQFSGRRTYIDLLLQDANEGITFKPIFFDLWSKISYRLNAKNSISFNALHATDISQATVREDLHNWIDADGRKSNNYLWANWKHMPHQRYQHLTTAGYQRLSRFSEFRFNNSITDNNVDNRAANVFLVRHTSYLSVGRRHNLEFGGELKYFDAHFKFKETRFNTFQSIRHNTLVDSIDVNSHSTQWVGGVFCQNTIHITDKLDIMTGVRLSYFSSITDPIAIAPRLSLGYQLSDQLSVKAAYGVYYQGMYVMGTRVFEGEPMPSDAYKQSMHYLSNITWSSQNTSLILNAYFKDNRKLQDDYVYDVSNRIGGAIAILDQSFSTVSGYSKGIEAIVRQKYGKRSSLSLSYAYAINKIRNEEGTEAFRDHDRRHTFIINNMLNLSRYWTISAYSLFFSGEPYTPTVPDFVGESGGRRIVFYNLGEKNSKRLPSFYSLDLRFDKSWYYKKWMLNVYLNLINLTAHENVRNYWWVPYENRQGNMVTERIKEIYFSKLIISPGISVKF